MIKPNILVSTKALRSIQWGCIVYCLKNEDIPPNKKLLLINSNVSGFFVIFGGIYVYNLFIGGFFITFSLYQVKIIKNTLHPVSNQHYRERATIKYDKEPVLEIIPSLKSSFSDTYLELSLASNFDL